MPHIISQAAIAKVLRISENTVATRMLSAPSWREGALKFYHTSEVFVWCDKYTKDWVVELLDASEDTEELYVGPNAIELGTSFELAATRLPDGTNIGHRIQSVRNAFASNLASADGSRAFWPYAEGLRIKLLLHSDIQRFCLTGDRKTVPDWSKFAPAFALVNSQISQSEIEATLRWAA